MGTITTTITTTTLTTTTITIGTIRIGVSGPLEFHSGLIVMEHTWTPTLKSAVLEKSTTNNHSVHAVELRCTTDCNRNARTVRSFPSSGSVGTATTIRCRASVIRTLCTTTNTTSSAMETFSDGT